MKAQLEAIEKKAFEELTAAQDLKDLDAVRVKYLGGDIFSSSKTFL